MAKRDYSVRNWNEENIALQNRFQNSFWKIKSLALLSCSIYTVIELVFYCFYFEADLNHFQKLKVYKMGG